RAEIHLKWNEYVRLFGTDEERINLLTQTAPAFFAVVDRVLWDDVLLHICRLTEDTGPPGKKERLTLQSFLGLVDRSILRDLQARLRAVADATVFAWDHRDR